VGARRAHADRLRGGGRRRTRRRVAGIPRDRRNLALLTAIIGAIAGANLLLLVSLDIVWGRAVEIEEQKRVQVLTRVG
jgi:hypothetical protein